MVPNGWDPEAAPPAGAPTGLLDPDRASLVYTGRFGSYGRDPRPLVEALAGLASSDPEAAAKLELVIAGPLTEEEVALFATDVAPARIVHAGSLERGAALALQREADALLLVAQPARSQLLNIKLFEYLASGRPILALAAGTEAGRVAAKLGCDGGRGRRPRGDLGRARARRPGRARPAGSGRRRAVRLPGAGARDGGGDRGRDRGPGPFAQSNACLTAQLASSERRRKPVLRRTEARWFCTVRTETVSRLAISLSVCPRMIRARTSRSRGVRS